MTAAILAYFAFLAVFLALFNRYLASGARRQRRVEQIYRRRARRSRTHPPAASRPKA